MFVHHPGAIIAIDGQDPALQLGIRMGADSLFEGGKQAVGKTFEGAVGHEPGRSTGPPGPGQPACRGPLKQGAWAAIHRALLRRPVGNRP